MGFNLASLDMSPATWHHKSRAIFVVAGCAAQTIMFISYYIAAALAIAVLGSAVVFSPLSVSNRGCSLLSTFQTPSTTA